MSAALPPPVTGVEQSYDFANRKFRRLGISGGPLEGSEYRMVQPFGDVVARDGFGPVSYTRYVPMPMPGGNPEMDEAVPAHEDGTGTGPLGNYIVSDVTGNSLGWAAPAAKRRYVHRSGAKRYSYSKGFVSKPVSGALRAAVGSTTALANTFGPYDVRKRPNKRRFLLL